MTAVLSLKPKSRTIAGDSYGITVFPTALGWTALAACEESLVRLVFGYADALAALGALQRASKGKRRLGLAGFGDAKCSAAGSWTASVQDRLEAFSEGQADDFLDLRVWSESWTPFQRRVLDCCRRIPYGVTQTYGELAIAAGSPGAARAVGRTMATNPIPLVIPCHRVLGSGGDLRGFSAIGGLDIKRRLLGLEQGASAWG
jgi:methylated-DNA-[protein]-cysteine S-methyltransferase